MQRHPSFAVFSSAALPLLSLATPVFAQSWDLRGVVLRGEQIDAVAGPDGRIHLVADRYHQIDRDGNVVLSEVAGDPEQNILWAFMYPPALSVAPDGTVHVVSRQKTRSSWDGWLDLRYQRRAPGGGWNAGYLLAAPTKWNWNVGVADDGRGHVHLMSSNHGGGGSVWADLRFFTDAGASPTDVGRMSNVYRVDYEARLRGRGGRVYFASSNSFTSSSAYFSHATGGAADLAAQLAGNLQQLRAGSGSNKGFPDMAIDGLGNVHYTYGSGYTNHSSFPGSTAGSVPGEVHYVRFDASGNRAFPSDRTLFTNLGVWHLSIGLSAVGVSDDGSTVVAVALRSPDHKEAANSELFWAVSRDGGASWSEPQSLGVRAFGGEGRQRPRLVALGSKFFLFYKANGTVGTSLATITFPEARPRAPTELVATPIMAVGLGRIQPCWRDNAADEDGYALERREEAGGFTELATTGPNITCYNDLSVEPGRTYSYRVRAVRGGTFYSNEASATAPEPPPPTTSDAGLERDAGAPSTDAGQSGAPDGGAPSAADAGAPDPRDPVDHRTMAGGCSVDGGGACWGAWLLLLVGRRRKNRRAPRSRAGASRATVRGGSSSVAEQAPYRSRLIAFGAVALAGAALSLASPVRAQSWELRGVVFRGDQIDAVAGPDGRVHVIADRYHQVDRDGNIVLTEEAGDPDHNILWAFMFPPALAVAPDGTVHAVSRHPAEREAWTLRYQRRAPGGGWSTGYSWVAPTKWNWNVGVADDGRANVFLMSTHHPGNDHIWADLRFFREAGGSAPTSVE